MSNTRDNRFQQRPQRSASAATGWMIGAVIVLLALAAVWYFGMRGSNVTTTGGTSTGIETPATPAPGKETPPATAEPGTATGSGGSTTAPAPAPAPAPATNNP